MTYKVLAALLLVALGGCGGGGDGGGGSTGRDDRQSFDVVYSVAGTGPVDVTFATSSGTAQTRAATGSFRYTRTARTGDFLYVAAQVDSSSSLAQVSTLITVNGQTFKNTFSSGPFVIATANGSCC